MKRRLARFLKWAAIAAGLLLAACLLASAVYTWTTGRRLEARLDALRSAGEPISIADLAPAPVPPDEDASVPLARAEPEMAALQKELTAIFPDRGTAGLPLSPDAREKLEAAFASHPEVIPLLREAANRPGYSFPFDASGTTTEILKKMLDRSQMHREASRILQSRSMLLADAGRGDEALEVQIDALRLARLPFREPTLTNYLVGIACTRTSAAGVYAVIEASPVTEDRRRALDEALAHFDDKAAVRKALQNERAYALTTVHEMSAKIFWLRGWMRNDLMLMILDMFDNQLSKTGLTDPVANSPSESLSILDRYHHPLRNIAWLLESSLVPVTEAARRQWAAIRSLRVLNALQVQVPGDAEKPPALDSLGLGQAIFDPVTGRPLIVKKRAGGWLVYSVGPDMTDDGGTFEKDRDIGFGPAPEEGPARP